MLENEVCLKKAVCYYGAPGTGKTYRSSKEAKKLIDAQRILIGKDVGGNYSIKTVQFHPSYSYEDFIEGIRPKNEGDLRLFNGSFKQFCKDNGEKEIKLYTETDFLKKEEFEVVEYDFARIRIRQLDEKERAALGLESEDYADGLTLQDAIEPAFFIIDEINRAELSKVFGELMYSLEYRGYRGKIKTQYSHLCQFGEDPASFLWEHNENWFFIPQNIYIISTMNNIDRSVDAFDFALRRRFMWKEVHPNYHVISHLLNNNGWGDYGQTIADRLKRLNDMIENDDILDKNYRIGQSYVLELIKMNPERFDTVNDAGKFIWDGFIAPLLEEYLKGLGNEQKSREKIDKFKIAFLN
jgi:5-methylcytosine-specific restriction protein B